ncbi:MAG: NAD(P)-dependent oxidoreductase [Candidatus Hodarchaeota archaeon]
MPETNVLFIWEVRDKLKHYLTKKFHHMPSVHLIFPDNISREALLELAPQADIMVGWRPAKELLLAAKRLTLLFNPGAGVQHLISLFQEVNKKRTKPLLLANGHGNSYFTAQHAVALLLALTNRVIPHHNWLKDGHWRKGDADAKSIPLRFRKIGLLGYGAVNQKVHRFLAGFNVEFSILRRQWGTKVLNFPTPARTFAPAELHSFLREVDTLVIAVPLTTHTRGMIGSAQLELLGSEGLLVNIARGEVIDEAALYKALKEEQIKGAAIDTWFEYRPESDAQGRQYPYEAEKHPFHTLDNVVLSPHRGASPLDDLKRWDEVVENITQFATGKREFINLVDLDREY